MRRSGSSGHALGDFVRNSDVPLFLLCVAASVYGCLLVYSAAIGSGGSFRTCLVHFIATGVGLIAAVLVSRMDYLDICTLWPVWLGVAGLLVLLTFTPLGLNVAGTDDTAWLGFPLSNPVVTFQPSELLKIAFILSFTAHLDKVRDHINRPLTVLLLCAHGGAVAGIVFLQGDDGTALVFLCIFACMLFVAGLHFGYFLGALGAVAAAVPFVWSHLDEQKLGRIMALIHVEDYLQTEGWQQSVGLSAMGTGQMWGVGYLNGDLEGLFARNNDFVFTVAGEEFGYIGSLILLLILLGLLLCVLRDAKNALHFRGKMICIGMAALIGFQSLINIGMVLRVLPVIGITLPFFSSGGSSVITLYLGMGLVMSVHYQSRIKAGSGLFIRREE